MMNISLISVLFFNHMVEMRVHMNEASRFKFSRFGDSY